MVKTVVFPSSFFDIRKVDEDLQEEFASGKSRQFVEESFDGSLPKFLTAFIGKQKLTDSEVKELKNLIDHYRE